MGVVWRARPADDGPEVAIKTVSEADEATLRSIRAEIRALRRMRHPGVVRILADGVRDGLPWYAMELLRGETLRSFVDELHGRERLPEESTMDPALLSGDEEEPAETAPVPVARGQLGRVLTLFRALAEVLAWLHGEGVVHRDLKPENVFVGAAGPVLVDFGMAHDVAGAGTSRESLDALALAGGTVSYMAPEQAIGDLVDARADLYAFGVMLFEALCGRPPFVGSRSSVVFAKIGQRAPSIDRFATDVPGPLAHLLEELLHPDPRSRTAHARVVSGVLASLGAQEPPSGSVQPRPYVYRPAFQPPGDVSARLVQAAQAGGGWWHVRGDAGSGRTRALVEVAQSLRQAGRVAVSCPCVPASGARTAAPLDPLRPLLRLALDRALAVPGGPDAEALAHHGALLARYEPSLRELPAVAGAVEPPELRPDTERIRLFAALRAVLELLARREALVLVVDDLQYADELTAAFLDSLEPADLERVVVLSSGTRPAPVASRSVELPPLTDEQVRAMLASMCGGTDVPPVLSQAIASRAAGHPFVVAELLRAAVHAGLLDRDRSGTWMLRSAELSALELPATVTELVDHRLAAVPATAWPALQWAAVLGFGAEEELLLRRADPADVDVLVRLSIVGFDERGRLRFPSPALAEVVHDRIGAEERRALHAEAATSLLPARPGRHGRVARHLREAGDPSAWEASLRAGEEALAGIAFERAVGELAYARHHLPTDAPPALRTRVELRLGRARWGAGDATGCSEALGSALEVAGERFGGGLWGGVQLVGLLLGELWRLLRSEPADPPPELAERHADLAEAHRYLVYLQILRNEPLPMLASALRASAHGSAGGRRARRASDLATLGVMAGFAGVDRLSRRWFDRAEERLAGSGDRHDEVLVCLALASLALGNARWEDLHAALDRGESAARAVGDAEQAAVCAQMRCTGLQLAGRIEDATTRCDEVLRVSRSQMPRLWARCVLVDALSSVGNTDRAVAEVRTVRAELGEGGDHATRSNVLALHAALLLDQGLVAEAREAVARASELCRRGSEEAFGVFPYHCHAPATWLRLAHEDRTLVAEAERAVEGAARYASRFAIGRAPALRHEGVLHALTGRSERARDALGRSREAASALGMEEHVLLADAEALRLAPDPERAGALRLAARRLGCAGSVRRTAVGG
ncbi:MAG: protein kinase [Alphaproteobacteria bacterium]|nr:protein kinase [Alphaproteobacteria bacterium]